MKSLLQTLLILLALVCGEGVVFSQETKDLEYAVQCHQLAYQEYELGHYSEAIRLGKESIAILKEILGEEHPDYATSLSNLALYYSKLGNYTEALRLGSKALEIDRKTLGEEHPDYALSLINLSLNYSKLGNYTEALRMATQAMQIWRRTMGEEHPDYATSLNNIALYHSRLGNYTEAIKLGTQAMQILRKTLGEEHPDYAGSLINLALYHSRLGNYTEAIKLGTQAMQILRKTLGEEDPGYTKSLNNLALCYLKLGNYTEAIKLATQAMQILKETLGEEHPDYATLLSSLAGYYEKIRNFREAIKLATRALEIRKKTLGEEHPDYATSLDNLAVYYSIIGNYTEAIKLATRALEIRKKTLGEGHPDYALSLSNLANCYYDIGNYPEAIKLQTQAMKIRRKALGEEHPDYATLLSNLALYYSKLGNYTEALRLGSKALEIDSKTLGEEHPGYALSLRNLSWYYAKDKDEKHLSITSSEATTRTAALIRKTFSDLTSSEREMFWEQYKKFFEKGSHRYAYQFLNTSLISDAYNSTLLSKGLLLNSDIAFNQLILESGDTVAVKMYEQLRMSRLQLNRLLEKPIVERMMNTDSLRNVVSEQEKALVKQSKIYGDFTKNLVIDWEQVQEKLGKKDIAVEFVSFSWNDSTMYAAYTIRKGWKNPKMTVLFEEKQLKAIPADSLYVSPAVSQLVWGPLVEDLSDADNIYFSPGGELYNIAIEYVPDAKTGKPFSEIKKLHRLSSTRELALTKEDNKTWKSAAVYGGLKYNMNGEEIITDSHKTRGWSPTSVSTHSCSIDSLSIRRDNIEYLPGTLVEAENVAKSLTQAHVSTKTYTDTLGTEPSFKALSGKRTNVLHIGTHGFYWNESEAHSASGQLSFLQIDNDRQGRYVEDKALTRSGLLLAGAQWTFDGKYLPDGVDDGILTAKELTTLDLRGLDLVVMSACQTGLGEITGDGVFGLQRGFKKAGANSLLMSLWKVDDDATQMLMTRFFDNLSHGKSKYEALKEAQQHLRTYTVMEEEQTQSTGTIQFEQNRVAEEVEEKEKTYVEKHPYEDPQFWAAFILVDGIR